MYNQYLQQCISNISCQVTGFKVFVIFISNCSVNENRYVLCSKCIIIIMSWK